MIPSLARRAAIRDRIPAGGRGPRDAGGGDNHQRDELPHGLALSPEPAGITVVYRTGSERERAGVPVGDRGAAGAVFP